MSSIIQAIKDLLGRPDMWPETKEDLRGYLDDAECGRLSEEDRGFVAALYVRLTGKPVSLYDDNSAMSMSPLAVSKEDYKASPCPEPLMRAGTPAETVSPEMSQRANVAEVVSGGLDKTSTPKTAEELLIDHVKEFRRSMSTVSVRLAEEVKEALCDADAKIERAKKFVHETGIDIAICRLVDEFEFPLRDRFAEAGLTGMRTEGSSYGEGTRLVSFGFAERSYSLRLLTKRGHEDPSRYGSLLFVEDGAEVFALDVAERVDDVFDHLGWDPVKVTLLVIGDWVSRMVELDERFKLARTQQQQAQFTEAVHKQAEGLFVERRPATVEITTSPLRPGESLAKALEGMPYSDRSRFLAYLEQRAKQSADLETLREIQAYRKGAGMDER